MTADTSVTAVLQGMDEYTRPVASESALLTIDVQRDFTRLDAPATVPGTIEAIPEMVRVIEQYRAWDRPIVHVVRLYHQDGSNVDRCRRDSIEQGEHCVVPGTDGSQLVTDLVSTDVRLDTTLLFDGGFQRIDERELIMYKPRWGAFYGTKLESHLDALGVSTVTVCGCNYPNCPRTTLYEASERDFRLVCIEDATSQTYDRGMNELETIGTVVLQTNDLSRWWEQTDHGIEDTGR